MKTHILAALTVTGLAIALSGCAQQPEVEPPASSPTQTEAAPAPTPTVEPTPEALTSEQVWNLCLDLIKAKDAEEAPDEVDTFEYQPYTAANVKDLGDGLRRASVAVLVPGHEFGSLSFCEISGDPTAPDVEYTGTVDGS